MIITSEFIVAHQMDGTEKPLPRVIDMKTTNESSPIQKLQTVASAGIDDNMVTNLNGTVSYNAANHREMVCFSSTPQHGIEIALPPVLPPKEQYEVHFEDPLDPCLPYNWNIQKKVWQVMVYIFPNILIAFMSSIYGPALPMVENEFNIGVTPAALGVSLFVLGFALGPIVWGPLSEVYGRRPPYIISQIAFICCSFASATAPNVQTLMLSRFFGGSFGAGAVSILPATISDLFSVSTRGNVMTAFTMATITGPLVSPIVGAFIAYSYLGWRWTQYIVAIPSCAAALLFVFAAEETYRPILLISKADELRQRTGIWGIHAEQESVSFDFKTVCQNNVLRPIKMLFTEPVLLIISIYVGYVYGILYLCLEAVPIIFDGYEEAGLGFDKGIKFLPYIGLLVGTLFAGSVSFLYFERRFSRTLKKRQPKSIPEARLLPMMTGAVSFPIGIFWSGAYPKQVHWLVPCVGEIFVTYGIFQMFLQSVNYITDVYIQFAASANSATAFVRAGMAAAFPLFATQLFHNLGVQWAGTLLGCLSVLALPFPFIFYRFGKFLVRLMLGNKTVNDC